MNDSTLNQTPDERNTFDKLAELALNLRWSWNQSTDELWGRLDPELWELTQNPWIVLQTVSQEKLQGALRDPAFCKRVDEHLAEKEAARQSVTWFEQAHRNSPLHLVAYFSMEYMLSESLPIYSGGLGNVAGDQLKAASDLGVPIVAVGLLYQQGYFRQELDADGNQQAFYPFNDPGQLPIKPQRNAKGEWLRLTIALPGITLWVRVWEARVGRAVLYLLDCNDPANPAPFRGITSELYGGGPELRIRQEHLLGIGGWRVLRALGLRPDVLHLNEGHAAFAVFERARSYMEDTGQSFDVAFAVTRGGNIFTTHTAVDAGFDRFDPALMERYFRQYAEQDLGIPFNQLMTLGRKEEDGGAGPFNMAYLAVRGSSSVNGVSQLHGQVSRRLFQPLFPRWPESQVPVGHVTNGIHVPTWESPDADQLWTAASGSDRWVGEVDQIETGLRGMSDVRLWQLRAGTTQRLIEFARKRLVRQRAVQGATIDELAHAGRIFDANILTLGFARRFATYKRPNLLLHDPERLLRILNNPRAPVQLILAGKAHPRDLAGQEMIREWSSFIRRPEARSRVVFLSDYDMLLTQHLVQGVDLWVNTPRRPWEASGTSGMKVLANGGLNLSELDGWWAEAYDPQAGWAIGDGQEHDDVPAWDAREADALYTLLEREVVPCFYNRDEHGIPKAWVAMMRESMARLTPRFSASRTVREYTETSYLPAAALYCRRAAENGKAAAEICAWQRGLSIHWRNLRFGEVQVDTRAEHVFRVHVYLGELPSDSVSVELYAEAGRDGAPLRIPLTRSQALVASAGGYLYTGTAPADRPASDYTPRIIPSKAGVNVPLEAPQILWQR